MDEYPIHQIPLSMEYVGTGDRNFYDRCYFAGHDRTGDILLITGLGVYPNLGVIDAYATVRRGDRQWAVRFSGALDDDRLHQRVGGYRIEVIEPLHKIRIVCDGDEHGIGFDLTWEGSFKAVQEAQHVSRNGRRLFLDASRFAQLGTWAGTLRVGGDEFTVDPAVWVGARDRSWGLRPVGEAEPPGRPADGFQGFWWTYSQLRFDDFAIVLLAQEEADGFRVANDAVRVWADGRLEQLGWPELDIKYRPGSRHPEHVTIGLRTRTGEPVTIEVDTLTSVALHVGAGYSGDPDWGHGQWKGPQWASGSVYDLTDPAVAGRIPYGVIDHVCRVTCGGAEGWGIFEHASIGRHDPTGFADFLSVAP
jgi:hypothetical protein